MSINKTQYYKSTTISWILTINWDFQRLILSMTTQMTVCPSLHYLAQTPNNVWTIRVTLCHIFSIISHKPSDEVKKTKDWVSDNFHISNLTAACLILVSLKLSGWICWRKTSFYIVCLDRSQTIPITAGYWDGERLCRSQN